ncbi:MAG: helix-turn-helix domain-containing protein, partial [Eubacteriales bacterium]|nr:helix-turn-helix domain-containing protein [Eubacteriales bacterium]
VSDIRMPVTDGLEVAHYVYQNCSETTEVILLTAYADFSYAQTAIRYNACDFVLKSSVAETLPAAVRKAQQSLKQKEDQRRKLMDAETVKRKNEHTQMENLLRGAAQGQQNSAGVFPPGFQPPYLVTSYEIARTVPVAAASARSAILNVLSMCLKAYESVSISISPTQYCSLICLPESDSSLRELMKELHNIISVLNNYTQYSVRIGLSAERKEPSALKEAYQESVVALNRLFNDHNVIGLYSPLSGDEVPALPDPRTLTDQLSELMQADRTDEAMALLKQYFDDFLRSGESIESLKLTSVLIFTTLTVNVGTIDTRDEWDEQTDEQFYLAVESARTVRNLYDTLTHYLGRYIALKQHAPAVKNNLIRQVNAYMHTNYAENINLQIIADMFHVSCGYLGRLYRRETGESLIIALNRRRIEVAKRLLRTTSRKVFEIAHTVGIDDPTYFTHIFVKYTGQSPSAYRNDSR